MTPTPLPSPWPPYPGDSYTTAENQTGAVSRLIPSLSFYWSMCSIVNRAANKVKAGVFTNNEWILASLETLHALERCGVKVTVEGMEHYKKLNAPCVFIGNHMSTLEAFILPGLIQPYMNVSFVVKESLLTYPFFCHVMRSRDPVSVQRKDPRADFTAVMEGGVERLAKGISMIIFPQSTRMQHLDPRHFNSMGVKLARRANVPIVPVALRSDAWGLNGCFGLFKDQGRVSPEIPVNIRFGEPMTVSGNGKAEHAAVYDFIAKNVTEWGLPPVAAEIEAHS